MFFFEFSYKKCEDPDKSKKRVHFRIRVEGFLEVLLRKLKEVVKAIVKTFRSLGPRGRHPPGGEPTLRGKGLAGRWRLFLGGRAVLVHRWNSTIFCFKSNAEMARFTQNGDVKGARQCVCLAQ